jgi:hypothetical protein
MSEFSLSANKKHLNNYKIMGIVQYVAQKFLQHDTYFVILCMINV